MNWVVNSKLNVVTLAVKHSRQSSIKTMRPSSVGRGRDSWGPVKCWTREKTMKAQPCFYKEVGKLSSNIDVSQNYGEVLLEIYVSQNKQHVHCKGVPQLRAGF